MKHLNPIVPFTLFYLVACTVNVNHVAPNSPVEPQNTPSPSSLSSPSPSASPSALSSPSPVEPEPNPEDCLSAPAEPFPTAQITRTSTYNNNVPMALFSAGVHLLGHHSSQSEYCLVSENGQDYGRVKTNQTKNLQPGNYFISPLFTTGICAHAQRKQITISNQLLWEDTALLSVAGTGTANVHIFDDQGQLILQRRTDTGSDGAGTEMFPGEYQIAVGRTNSPCNQRYRIQLNSGQQTKVPTGSLILSGTVSGRAFGLYTPQGYKIDDLALHQVSELLPGDYQIGAHDYPGSRYRTTVTVRANVQTSFDTGLLPIPPVVSQSAAPGVAAPISSGGYVQTGPNTCLYPPALGPGGEAVPQPTPSGLCPGTTFR